MKNSVRVLLACFALVFLSCKKDMSPGGNKLSYTPVITDQSVNANLVVYPYFDQPYTSPTLSLYKTFPVGYIPFYTDNNAFMGGPYNMDKYAPVLIYFPVPWYNYTGATRFYQYKSFTVSSNVKNYVGLNKLIFNDVGYVRNLASLTVLQLPGGGRISFPAGAMSSDGVDINYGAFGNYFDPTAPGFAADAPGLPFADKDQKRGFLDSYGIYQIELRFLSCNCGLLSESDMIGDGTLLELPIPDSRKSAAPDSIEAWHFDSYYLKWLFDGYAYKKDGMYQKHISRTGAWNFAKPVDAVYVTIQLRTSNNAPIPNTRYVVSTERGEIAEGRTDVDGNALILTPVNAPLHFTIINDHNLTHSNINWTGTDLGSFSRESAVKVTLPDRIDVGSLEGNVYNCDGSSFGDGTLLIAQSGAKDVYSVPITAGKFITGNWLGLEYGSTKLSFYDKSGNLKFEQNTYLASLYSNRFIRLKEDFYACPEASKLYAYLKIDNKESVIRGDMSQATPTLTMENFADNVRFTIGNNKTGISFPARYAKVPNTAFDWVDPLIVNGQQCRITPGSTPELVIYRHDNFANKIIEGWFAIDYLDAKDAPHVASGNFRLRITN